MNDYPINDRRNPNYIQNQAIGRYLKGRKKKWATEDNLGTPTGQPDTTLDDIIQQMLVDYTAWVNGEPVAWNVKKAEAKAALLAYVAGEKRKARIDELKYIKVQDPEAVATNNVDWTAYYYIHDRIEQLKQEGGDR